MNNLAIDNGAFFDFGLTSENYGKYRDIYPKSMYDFLVQFGVGKKGQKIIDLGSGTAILPMNLYNTGAIFVSTDISRNQINIGKQIAKRKGMNNITFKTCPAESTGFNDNSFDVVTAVQCFHYFDSNKVAKEIKRISKNGAVFCKIFMDWLPFEDEIVHDMEQLVLKYNPNWTGYGFKKYEYTFPEWAKDNFEIDTIKSYNETLEFTKDDWIGRILSCRGVGASLSDNEVKKFEKEYREMLSNCEVLKIKHQIHIEIYRVIKGE